MKSDHLPLLLYIFLPIWGYMLIDLVLSLFGRGLISHKPWESFFRYVKWRLYVVEDSAVTVFYLPLADELVNEKEKYKNITDELDQTFSELSGY